ncbi:ATP-dependent DNA helicase sgs1 [Tulasnella sp. 331]|nr:ATP-dependent DNA helicase sgs1 [Tulasnella sp. 331]
MNDATVESALQQSISFLNGLGLSPDREQIEAVLTTSDTHRDLLLLGQLGPGRFAAYSAPELIRRSRGESRRITLVICGTRVEIRHEMEKALSIELGFAVEWDASQFREPGLPHTIFDAHQVLPACFFITPNDLQDGHLRGSLERLIRQKVLDRIVIPEAQAIASLQHSALKMLQKSPFQLIPVTALSNAAPQAVLDALKTLLFSRDPVIHTIHPRSTRNLTFSVKPKQSTVDADIMHFINQHPTWGGIIFCKDPQDCQQMAQYLHHHSGHDAQTYHNRLEDARLLMVRQAWMQGHLSVILVCSGDDSLLVSLEKRDIRFVIHHTLPASLSTYDRETSMAGHDSLPSQCLIFYDFRDYLAVYGSTARRLTENQRYRLIPLTTLNFERISRHAESKVLEVIKMCRERDTCRRLLIYGSSSAGVSACGACDNCLTEKVVIAEDVSPSAREIVAKLNGVLSKAGTHRITALQLAKLMCGTLQHAKDEWWDRIRLDIPRWQSNRSEWALEIIRAMIVEGILKERHVRGTPFYYIRYDDSDDWDAPMVRDPATIPNIFIQMLV